MQFSKAGPGLIVHLELYMSTFLNAPTKIITNMTKAVKLACANKTEGSITSQKLGSRDFWQIANCSQQK